jgi:hypothetical protein
MKQIVIYNKILYAVNQNDQVVASADGGSTWAAIEKGMQKITGASSSIALANGALYCLNGGMLYKYKL